MGEVFRARDTRLGREVAVKIILEPFASDGDRVARFQREAKVLASLNHPHIAALYGMEEADGQHFLVMELVEGQTLADRLARGPLPVDETLAIGVQIADALEAAHEKGIVHRDLKPANVKVTPDDRVKVLDFGLAKAIETEAGSANAANSPTLSMMASQAGIILGTAAYMSPEQAKGFPADHRSDIFSFGSVLFEMLTGRQPFQGDTAPEVLASVLVREPELSRLPKDLHPRLTEIIRRCLEKNPKRRWQAIGDVRAELETIAAAPKTDVIGLLPTQAPRPLWRRVLPAVVPAAVVGVLAGTAAWMLKPAPARPIARFSIAFSVDQRLTSPSRRIVAISPDGTLIAYVADNRIYLRPIGELRAAPLAGTESPVGVTSPVFSPDGKWIAFYSNSDGTLKRVAVTGGAAVTLCEASNPDTVWWGPEGILFSELARVRRVPAGGGSPQVVATFQDDEFVDGPNMLPDGDTLLIAVGSVGRVGVDRWDHAKIMALSLKSGARKVVIDGGSDARYLRTGHLVYALGGVVYAVPFNLRTLTVNGEPSAILQGVRRAPSLIQGFADFAVSDNGTLAYIPGPAITSDAVALTFADAHGGLTALKLPADVYTAPRITSDGRRVALQSTDGRFTFIGIYDTNGATGLRRITFGANAAAPVWSPDGKRVAFQFARDGDPGIFMQSADGSDAPVRLTKAAAGEAHVPQSWSGDVLLFDVVKQGNAALFQLSMHDHKIAPFDDVHSSGETGAAFSPDGKWVAYSTTVDRVSELFVQPFPATGARHTLVRKARNPHNAVWSRDGSSLFYIPGPGVLERVAVQTRPAFSFGLPENVQRPFQGSPPGARRIFDPMPDGRILALVSSGQTTGTPFVAGEIDVVLNWFDEITGRARRDRR